MLWIVRVLLALALAACCFVSPLATHHSNQIEATPSDGPPPVGPMRVYASTALAWTAGWDLAAVGVQGDFVAPPGAIPWSEDPTPPPPPQEPPAAEVVRSGAVIRGVNLTFYDCLDGGFCGRMFDGENVYEGATACSWNLPIGTRFYILGDPSGRAYVCKDRGMLSDTWIDVFFHNPEDGWVWQHSVGRSGTIKVISIPN
ncbi:MAG TPA: hypothetical protein VFY10_06585 [Dehalococcoidia bacterium]|nr:hypothetical protein [Dehalococcoidia bacterium]